MKDKGCSRSVREARRDEDIERSAFRLGDRPPGRNGDALKFSNALLSTINVLLSVTDALLNITDTPLSVIDQPLNMSNVALKIANERSSITEDTSCSERKAFRVELG